MYWNYTDRCKQNMEHQWSDTDKGDERMEHQWSDTDMVDQDMEYYWSDTGRVKQKYTDKNQSSPVQLPLFPSHFT